VNAHATDFGPNGLDSDTDPVPDFQPAIGGSTHVKFVARDADTNAKIPARFYVGHYQGRVSPIADTEPATPGTGAPAFAVNLDDQASFVPGTYEFTANAPGYGIVRFRETFQGGSKTVTVKLAPNWASTSQGATATGDTSGANAAAQAAQLRNLIDDNEATNWTTAANAGTPFTVDGKKVTVDLAGTSAKKIRYVQVSAMLAPGQNRFSALRKFEIWACNAAKADCTSDAGYTLVYTSPNDAFPSTAPRPVAPTLILRKFPIPDTNATHLRLVVKESQCTGGPDYQGDQDADPSNDSDCNGSTTTNIDAARFVRAAELEAFTSDSTAN
jgi:hypothetical protein